VTSRARVVAGLALICSAAGLVSQHEVFFNLAYFWGGLLALAAVWSWLSLRGVHVERMPRSQRGQVGRAFEEMLLLRNESRFPKLWVEVLDRSTLPGHRASVVFNAIRARQIRLWNVRTLCTHRGVYSLGPMVLRSGDPFGLFPRQRVVGLEQELIILPRIETLTGFMLPSGRLPGGAAVRYRTQRVTTNAATVREYAPGDTLSRIHWRSTARHRRLMVKEFEMDPLAEIWLVLDVAAASQVGSVQVEREAPMPVLLPGEVRLPRATEEATISLAASLAFFFLQRDRAVGLIAYGDRRYVIQSERGQAQFSRLAENLALMRAQGRRALEEVLRVEVERLPRGAGVIVVSPQCSSDLLATTRELRRKGCFPLLLLWDRRSFGGQDDGDRMLRSARALGLTAHMLRYGIPLAEQLPLSRGQVFSRRAVRL